MTAFLRTNIYSETLVFFVSQAKYMKKTKKPELNLDIEFSRVVLSIIFASMEKLRNPLYNSMLKKTG